MNTRAPKLECTVQADGRIAYTVAGVLTTYDAQEAIDLMQTGIFTIACPLTRRAAQEPTQYRMRVVGVDRPVIESYTP